MDMYAAYQEVGTYRAAAQICGTTDKTVKRAVASARGAEAHRHRREGVVEHNYDDVADIIAERVERTEGRISAKRLLPVVRAAGYEGSARNFRRAVAEAKAEWRVITTGGADPGCGRRATCWCSTGGRSDRCSCSAPCWPGAGSASCSSPTTSVPRPPWRALAQCMETIGGVPKTLLTDRMGCLKGGTVAGLVIPTPAYVRFVTHYGTRPDFCEGADPESKGIVENLVGYVKSDLMIPEELSVADLTTRQTPRAALVHRGERAGAFGDRGHPGRTARDRASAARATCRRLRARIGKVVMRKVDRLSCVRFGSARYSVPNVHIGRQVELRVADGTVMVVFLGEIIATHGLVAPGETAISDEHYGGPRPAPARAVRPKTPAEKAFCALGPVAEAFIKGAAARGVTTLAADLAELCAMEAAHGRDELIAALERAGRVRPVPGPRRALDPGRGHRGATAPSARRRAHRRPARRRHPLARRLRHRGGHEHRHRSPLAADLEAGLRRLRLGAMRRLAPSCWWWPRPSAGSPRSSCAPWSRPRSPRVTPRTPGSRCRRPPSRSTKTLDEFDVDASSVQRATFDYLVGPRVDRGQGESLSRGPGGDGQVPPPRRPRTPCRRGGKAGPLLQRHRSRRDPLPRAGRQLGRPGDRADHEGRPRS